MKNQNKNSKKLIYLIFLYLISGSFIGCAGSTEVITNTGSNHTYKIAEQYSNIKVFMPSTDGKSWIPAKVTANKGDILFTQDQAEPKTK